MVGGDIVVAHKPELTRLHDTDRDGQADDSGTGGEARKLSSEPSEPSVSTSASCTILTTIWPGVTDLSTAWPMAWAR